jgi:hypothetical protein
MTRDPFAPARRGRIVGPAMMLAGAVLVYVGIAGDGLAWLFCVAGGLLGLAGLLRLLGGVAVLAFERRRLRLLRDGVPATGKILSTRQLGEKLGHPIFESEFELTAPDGTTHKVMKHGAVEPQYAGEMTVGNEFPVRMNAGDPSTFAIDWDNL